MRRPSPKLPCVLIFLAHAFTCLAAPAAVTVPATEDWRPLILPREELPAETNALVRWRPHFESLFPFDREMIDFLQQEMSPLSEKAPDSAAFDEWLRPRLKHLPTFELRAGETIQLPRLVGPETPFPDHQPLRQIAQLRVAAMKAAWRADRHDQAVALAIENLKLARALLNTQEGLIPLLNASGIWQFSLDGVYWLARQPELTPRQAALLQTNVSQDNRLAVSALSRAFRGEFTFFTHLVLERMPRTHDVELLLSSIGSLGMAPPAAPPEGEPRLAIPVREPLDREATLQSSAVDIRGWLNAFESTGRHPLTLHATHTHVRLREYAKEIPLLFRYATDEAPPLTAQIPLIDAEIATVENPVGKLFLVLTTSQWAPISISVFRREAQRSALTGLLAWRRAGKPAAWDELIKAGLLAAPPSDPFADAPLQFDVGTSEPRIWSVGANGSDEGGKGDGENLGQPDDLTWPAGTKN